MSRCFSQRVGARLILLLALSPVGAGWPETSILFAAEAPRPLPYLVQSWQTEHGLPQNYVTSIAQTDDGYLWIGTYNGLARFDGVRFVTYDPDRTPELKHAHVHKVLTDTHGTLWISTSGGGLTAWRDGAFRFEWLGSAVEGGVRRLLWSHSNEVLFALSTGRLLRGVTTAHGTNRWEVIATPADVSSRSAGRDGTVLWLMTNGHLSRLEGDQFQPLPSDAGLAGRRVRMLLTDHAGRLWAGTDKEIAVWEPERELRSKSEIGNPKPELAATLAAPVAAGRFRNMTPTNGETALAVTGMAASGDGIWVTANGRTRRCRERQWVAEAAGWQPEPSALAVGYYGDREGGMWAYFGTGLLHVRPDGEVRRITTEHGLANDRVACWFQDREGNIWAGLNRGGLVRVRPRYFQVLGVAEGLSDQVAMSVCEDADGAIWVGTYGGGLNRWRHGVFEHFNLGLSDTPGIVVAVCPDEQGRVWIGTAGNGVWVHEQGEFKRHFSSQPLEDRAYAIFVDRSGGKWMGNRRGLFLWKNGELKQYGTADGVPSTDVRAFAEDAAGAIWIGATDGALYRFADGKFNRFRAPDALGRQPVYSLLADDHGTVWMGTFRGGLVRFKDGRFTRCTTREGLPNNVVCHILDDNRGQLWMSSHQGIFRVTKSAFHAFARGESQSVPCVAYGKFDGLPTLECTGNYQPAGWRGRDGRLWFATVKGVVSVQPDEVTVNPLPPPVVIEEVVVDGQAKSLKRLSVEALKREADGHKDTPSASTLQPFNAFTSLKIGPGRHHVEFRFTGLSFSAPDKVQFQYKLEGLDRGWLDGGGTRTASYSYMPAGDYRFQVRACNNDGVWNESGASLAFVVLPYFWQTWWFLALAALTAFGTVGGVIRFVEKRKLQRRLERLERERAIERERARIAQDIHDDLGASLTRITLLSETARENRSGDEPPTADLDQIYSTARELTRAMDEIVWAVNPQHDTLDSLATYLGKFAQDFLRVAGVRCRLDMPVQLPALPLTSEARHNLFLAFKEALHNTMKHAAASEVRVQLKIDPAGFTLTVEDNGRGFAAHEPSPAANGATGQASRLETGHGLKNMRQRLEEIGGRCEVETRLETGACVRFVVPMPIPKAGPALS